MYASVSPSRCCRWWLLLLLLLWTGLSAGSEFPERECCGPADVEHFDAGRGGLDHDRDAPELSGGTRPASEPMVPPHPVEFATPWPDHGPGRAEWFNSNAFPSEFIPELSRNMDADHLDHVVSSTPGVHQGAAGQSFLNCLLARQLCAEDVSCSSILHVIRHMCGPETVACATTTVTKCQAGLRTLQAFPYFNPTCLCREAYVDPDCNYFRDFLFDHQCMAATQREKDPYPIHALPTCTHAHEVCQKDMSCTRLYADFKEHCKVRDGVCRDRESCHNAWRGLRMTPLFGCICPNSPHQKKCDRVYNIVYNNSCLVGAPGGVHVESPLRSDGSTATRADAGVAPTNNGRRQQHRPSLTDRSRRSVAGAGAKASSAPAATETQLLESPLMKMASNAGADVRSVSHYKQTSFLSTGTGSTTFASAEENDTRIVIYQSTCHRALSQCQADASCRRLLDPFLRYCDTCNRDLCMQALQNFYKDAPLQWSLEVAFCVCKKSTDPQDSCALAQERLHPDCARQPDRSLMAVSASAPKIHETDPSVGPACHVLAEVCKNHPDCKPRLEFYEQACAVDVVTKGCAEPPSICRRAVLDILGTELRTTCSCRGSDLAALYDCLEWQRLLWLNPCVVEAQRDFHRVQGNMAVVTAPSVISTTTGTSTTTTLTTMTRTLKSPTSVGVNRSTLQREEKEPWNPPTHSPDPRVAPDDEDHDVVDPPALPTRRPAVDLVASYTPRSPRRVCLLERPGGSVVEIAEGSGKRLYDEDDPDCSELCQCEASGVARCSISDCSLRKACGTGAATYSHATHAFQAYRGDCFCFSGSLVCAKPNPGQYSLPLGVFLFVGYSKIDERAMYQFTHLNVSKHLLGRLQKLMETPQEPENECRISIHDQDDENIILQVRLAELDVQRANESVTLEMLTNEKKHCWRAADELRNMINLRSIEVKEDELLSVVKVADVVTNLPEPRRSNGCHVSSQLSLIFTNAVLVFMLIARLP